MATIEISVKGKQAEAQLKRLQKEFGKTDVAMGKTAKSNTGLNSSILKSVAGYTALTVGVVALAKGVSSLLSGSLKYNIQMDASSSKLKAMVSASRGYETTLGRQVGALERINMINNETAETMAILEKANSQTAMGITELIDIYALMKPGMDQVNVSAKDQVDILKLVTNTASNFGLSAQELSTGIDDLARGTWISTSGFGKMAKALGLTKEEVKGTADLVGLLSDKMKETGQSQDNWATAVSNFGVAWDKMSGKITAPLF